MLNTAAEKRSGSRSFVPLKKIQISLHFATHTVSSYDYVSFFTKLKKKKKYGNMRAQKPIGREKCQSITLSGIQIYFIPKS